MKTNPVASVFILISLFIALTSTAQARQCVRPNNELMGSPQKPTVKIIVASEDHPHFKDAERRCQHYWPYFSGKVRKPDGSPLKQVECRKYADWLKLSDGFAPLGVFMRSQVSHPDSRVASYFWEIRGPIDQRGAPLITTYDSFNAGYVFDTPGQYEASLRVTFADGSQSNDKYQINVWPRNRTIYHINADIGDDRYDGKKDTAQENCQPEGKAVGTCPGPWKTATRAFSVLDPRDWRMKGSQRYSAESICLSATRKLATRYPDGDYTLYRGQTTQYPDALKDKAGRFFPQYEVEACERLAPRMAATVKPGDQVLFQRGQTFEFETGLLAIEPTKRNIDNQAHSFEKLSCTPLIAPNHWATPMGILFGAYGTGEKPVIRNTGQHSCIAFQLTGVGVMHLAFEDLSFDLESSRGDPKGNRSNFMLAIGNPINLVLNRVSVSRFDQGIQFHNAHGVFLQESRLHDSKVVHLYSETATDVLFLHNEFDYSGNHIAYTNMGNALVVGNTFKRQAFGRTALRLFGSDLAHPTESIWVSDNVFEGWVDPRTTTDCTEGKQCQFADGKRYNYSLVEFNPNNPQGDKFSENIVFTRNYLSNTENMMRIGGIHNMIVKDNIFDTADGSGISRVHLTDAARRPLKNILIEDNLFIERASATKTVASPQIELTDYSQITCDDLPVHTKLRINQNRFLRQKDACAVRRANPNPALRSCLDEVQPKDNIQLGRLNEVTVSSNQYLTGGNDSIATEITKMKGRWKKSGINQSK